MSELMDLPNEMLEQIALFLNHPLDYGHLLLLNKTLSSIFSNKTFKKIIFDRMIKKFKNKKSIQRECVWYSVTKKCRVFNKRRHDMFRKTFEKQKTRPKKYTFYKTGRLHFGKKIGEWMVRKNHTKYDYGSMPTFVFSYKNGKRKGLAKILDDEGKIYAVGFYIKGRRKGVWKYNIQNRKDKDELLEDIERIKNNPLEYRSIFFSSKFNNINILDDGIDNVYYLDDETIKGCLEDDKYPFMNRRKYREAKSSYFWTAYEREMRRHKGKSLPP